MSQGFYPAIDPLESTSSLLTADAVGLEHYSIATETKALLARYEELRDVIAILGLDELSPDDQQAVIRARRLQRFLTQPFFASETFTGLSGRYVQLGETLRGFREILDGKHDNLPEQAFYMVGAIDEVVSRAASMGEGETGDG